MIDSRSAMLDQLLDRQRAAWLSGEKPSVESLLHSSGLVNDPDAQLDLIYQEILVREECGETVSRDEYVQQYPQLKTELLRHFEIHAALQDCSLLETDDRQEQTSWSMEPRYEIPPESIGDYELLQRVGEGGMAVVYRARHRRLRRQVALKLFRPGMSLTRRELARIRTEAEAMARLSHPHIVPIYEIEPDGSTPFLALELAEGGTLADRLRIAPLSPEEAVTLLEALVSALEHAHAQQVIHRDIKPANVLFMKNGTPKLTDFGLARLAQEEQAGAAPLTLTGEMLGTPRYMSPEQAAGDVARIGPATDLYSLGTLLYECLTGRAPFTSSSVVDTLERIQREEPVSPRQLQPSVPPDLELICLHCLEKDPRRRYPSAKALREDLGRYRRREPISVCPPTALSIVWKWCRRNSRIATVIAASLLVFLLACSYSLITARQEEHRLHRLRTDVSQLITAGRQALDREDHDVAEARFQLAWQLVESEPALSDHVTGVTGWLDHARNAAQRSVWSQRIPPREFDARRDEACLLSLLLCEDLRDPAAAARDAIADALEFTVANDPAWHAERLGLALLDVDVIAATRGPDAALDRWRVIEEPHQRLSWTIKAELLDRLHRTAAAAEARATAEQFPPQPVAVLLRTGMQALRQRQFTQAINTFDELLSLEPEHFVARLCQAVAFQRLDRLGEARVALTACLAQRPRFHWNCFLRGELALQEHQLDEAGHWLADAVNGRSPELLSYLVSLDRGRLARSQQKLQPASDAFQTASTFRPAEPVPHIELAITSLQRYELALARKHWLAAYTLEPQRLWQLTGRAVCRDIQQLFHRPVSGRNDFVHD